jgi:hypothetical protein
VATWTAVDDDLPFEREVVLVCNVLDQQIFCACRETADRWRLSEGETDGILTVTHWMPLPAPPPLSQSAAPLPG